MQMVEVGCKTFLPKSGQKTPWGILRRGLIDYNVGKPAKSGGRLFPHSHGSDSEISSA